MTLAGGLMDVVLIGLLIAALVFGMRLDKRLKALRAAHDGFAKAVAELDNAAIRAHQSLKDLRAHADDSQELLHGRILAGRELIQKLESQVSRAEKAQIAIEKGQALIDQKMGDLAVLGTRQAQVETLRQDIVRPEPARPLEATRFDADRFSPLREAMRARMTSVVSPTDDDYNPAWSGKAAKQPAPRGAPSSTSDHPAFARDVVRADDAPPPRAPHSSRSMAREDEAAARAEMLDKVQMSELVVANLNEMIRSFSSPTQAPIASRAQTAPVKPRRAMPEDDLFGADSTLYKK